MRKRRIATLITLTICSATALAGAAQAGVQKISSFSTTTATSAPAAISRFDSLSAPPQAGNYKRLAFHTNFSNKLNHKVWATCYPWANPKVGCTNFGNKNEQEWYKPSQVTVKNGLLRLKARRVATQGTDKNGAPKTYYCRSGMVTTFPGFHFKYGYLQIVARIPYATGLWPALWLTPANQSWPPEIDLMEHWAKYYTYHVYFHSRKNAVQSGKRMSPNLSKGWHTFSVYWSKKIVIWYIDGRKMLTVKSWVPQQPMAFVADLADYKPPQKFGGCSGTMLIRSVKLWKP